MSGKLVELAQVIRALPRRDAEELRDWLEDYLEDQLEFTDAFAAAIDRGKKDLAEGNARVRQPEQA